MRSRLRGVHGAVAALALAFCASGPLAGCSDDSGAASAPTPDASAAETDAPVDVEPDTEATKEDTAETPAPDVAVEPPVPTFEGSFAPDDANPAGASIVAEVEPLDGTTVTVRVRARELSDVLGVAFKLQFDPSVLQYTGGEASDVLSDAKAKGYAAASESEPGEIVFGHARFAPQSDHWYAPPELSGVALDDAVLLTLTLEVKAAGTTSIAFLERSRDVRDSEAEQITVTWSGGTLTVTEAGTEGGAL